MPHPFLSTAVEVARRAGEILLGDEGDPRVDFKGAVDLVTDYDHRAEAFIAAALREAFPAHGLRAEEGSRADGAADYEWLIDPLDGTTNFAHGLPIYSIALALLHRGEPIVGVVYDPTRDECFTAAKGQGAFLNDRRLAVSTAQPLGVALLVTGFPYDLRTNPDNNLAEFGHFALRAQAVRRLGSAALDLAYVAAGRLDGYWESRLNAWDVAAGVLMVQEAGGRVTDYRGRVVPVPNLSLVASNGFIHEEMLVVLRDGADAPRP